MAMTAYLLGGHRWRVIASVVGGEVGPPGGGGLVHLLPCRQGLPNRAKQTKCTYTLGCAIWSARDIAYRTVPPGPTNPTPQHPTPI